MNARAGLIRIWIVASIAWVVFCAWRSDLSCPLALVGIETPAGPWCAFENADPFAYYGQLALQMVAVPIAAWIAGAAVLWIWSGFKRAPANSQ